MKQLYIQIEAQNRKGINDAYSGINQSTKSNITKFANPQITPPSEGQGGGFKFSKGPPGRARSPGVGDGLFPDHPPDDKKTVVPVILNVRLSRIEVSFQDPNALYDKPQIPGTRDGVTGSTSLKHTYIRQLTEIPLNTEYQTFNTKLFQIFIHN
jgi:hypothetical protein